jgi:putative pyruvate formate lyase activating enzyme
MMLELQALGCENINLVSPSHVVPQILQALVMAVEAGLHLPLVYNSGGYDALNTLRLLDGVVDIYMPDMKYADASVGERLSGVPDYPARNRAAVLEMHRQVGDLALDERGVARCGLLVRHLALPGGLAGTPRVAAFIAAEVSADTYVNVMEQYRPAHRAACYPELCRPLTAPEYAIAVEQALAAGLWRLDGRVEGAGP